MELVYVVGESATSREVAGLANAVLAFDGGLLQVAEAALRLDIAH